MEILFAIISAIPILDKWFNSLSQLYRTWKFNSDQQAASQAFQKAEVEQSTEDLQKQIGGE
jgi:ABC-type uncharacterized transport system involved in gliding motility auxiliary subunit